MKMFTGLLCQSLCCAFAAFAAFAMNPAQAQKPGDIIKDCKACPEIVVIPPGSFKMGFEGAEPVRPNEIRRYEGPERTVTITKAFGAGRFEVTNEQFAAFVTDTGYVPLPGCFLWDGWDADFVKARGWDDPGYGRPPGPKEPVVCVNWYAARAYVEWLSRKTGRTYRLLTEAEWEHAARGGTTAAYQWGDQDERACEYANVFDASAVRRRQNPNLTAARCDDGYPQVAPVGKFKPNAFGLYDMSGNVWEWVQDCHVMPYPADAPTDGSAVVSKTCDRRGVKGGAWMTTVDRQRFTFRGRDPAHQNSLSFGFRVARDL
jgi:formylglycine-generating enzyme required for sulfatase activity